MAHNPKVSNSSLGVIPMGFFKNLFGGGLSSSSKSGGSKGITAIPIDSVRGIAIMLGDPDAPYGQYSCEQFYKQKNPTWPGSIELNVFRTQNVAPINSEGIQQIVQEMFVTEFARNFQGNSLVFFQDLILTVAPYQIEAGLFTFCETTEGGTVHILEPNIQLRFE